MSDQAMHSKEYIGRDGFVWWIGQIPEEGVWKENISGFPSEENTESKGWGERYRVRIMGSMIDSWESDSPTEDPDISDEELPWAMVMYPVTAGGGSGGGSASANISQGTYVFGFYMDGDGVAPNGNPAGFGITFPTSNVDTGDYFLRTDYLPNRLFRFDGTRWIKMEDSVRITMSNTDTKGNWKTSFVNNTTESTINGLTVTQRQSLSDALKPKADN